MLMVRPGHRAPGARHRTGGVNWLLFAGSLSGGLAAAAGVAYAGTAAGLPVTFAVSGTAFKVSATELDGEGFVQFASVDRERTGSGAAVAVTGIRSATLKNLCQSAVIDTPLGSVTLRVTAGDGEPVRTENLVIDLQQMQGDAFFTDLQLGRDASDSQTPGLSGTAGQYSQQAGTIVLRDLRLQSRAATAGTFHLTGLRLSVSPGVHECF